MLACRTEVVFDVAILSIVSDTSDEFPESLVMSNKVPKSVSIRGGIGISGGMRRDREKLANTNCVFCA